MKVFKFISVIFLLFISFHSNAQQSQSEGNNDNAIVPFEIIEEVPVFQGCIGTNKEKRDCLSLEFRKIIARNFNQDLANCLETETIYNSEKKSYEKACKSSLKPGKYVIYTFFLINKEGNIDRITTRGPHPILEEEAIRVLNKIPQMKPGKQKGKNINVKYSLPIVFMVE